MWKSLKESAQAAGRRASIAASEFAHRTSTFLQAATKGEVTRAGELYTRIVEITQDKTSKDKIGDIDRLIGKFRAKLSSAGVVWHEGFILRVAYLYFLNKTHKPLKTKILVAQTSWASVLLTHNPSEHGFLTSMLEKNKIIPRRFFQNVKGHSSSVIAAICADIHTLNKLHAVLKSIDPGELNCPTLTQYCQRPQFNMKDLSNAMVVDIENLDVVADMDPRDEIDLGNLFNLLLAPDFYQTVVADDPAALVLWSYLLGVITSLIHINNLTAHPSFQFVPHTLTGFLNRVNDLARQKGLGFETINRTNTAATTALERIFVANRVFIDNSLSSLATKQLYLASLDAMHANPSISRVEWLTGMVKKIVSSGKLEDWMLFAEALDTKAQQFFATVMPPEQLYEPVVARIATERVDPLANATQRMSSFLADRQDLTLKILTLNTTNLSQSVGEHPILILGLTQMNFTPVTAKTPTEQSLWAFYFAWNLALLQFANPDPRRIPPIPEVVTHHIPEHKHLFTQFAIIIKQIFPKIAQERIYEATPGSAVLQSTLSPTATAPATAAAPVLSSGASASAAPYPIYARLDEDEHGDTTSSAEYTAVTDATPPVPARILVPGAPPALPPARRPTGMLTQPAVYEAPVNPYQTVVAAMPPTHRQRWLKEQLTKIKASSPADLYTAELYAFTRALDAASMRFFTAFYAATSLPFVPIGAIADPATANKIALRELQVSADLSSKMEKLQSNATQLLEYLSIQISRLDIELVTDANRADWEFFMSWICALVIDNASERLVRDANLTGKIAARIPNGLEYLKDFEFIIQQSSVHILPPIPIYEAAPRSPLALRAPTPPRPTSALGAAVPPLQFGDIYAVSAHQKLPPSPLPPPLQPRAGFAPSPSALPEESLYSQTPPPPSRSPSPPPLPARAAAQRSPSPRPGSTGTMYEVDLEGAPPAWQPPNQQ